MEAYPDGVTYALVAAAVAHTGFAADRLLREFGRHWIAYARRAGYEDLLRLVGRDLPDFLANLDAMHARLGLTFAGMDAPSFGVRPLGTEQLEVVYTSSRPGLAPFVEGLLLGLADFFGTEVDVRATGTAPDGSVVFQVELRAAREAALR
jgi:hypothetical protein